MTAPSSLSPSVVIWMSLNRSVALDKSDGFFRMSHDFLGLTIFQILDVPAKVGIEVHKSYGMPAK